MSRLQNRPDEGRNLCLCQRSPSRFRRRQEAKAYRRQGRQDVDLPDPATLQISHRGRLLGLVLWRHLCTQIRTVRPATERCVCDRRSVGRKSSRWPPSEAELHNRPTAKAEQAERAEIEHLVFGARIARVALDLTLSSSVLYQLLFSHHPCDWSVVTMCYTRCLVALLGACIVLLDSLAPGIVAAARW